MMFTSCAHYSTTQQNIKKVNDAFEVKKEKVPAASSVKAIQSPVPEQPGSMPLSKFLDSKTFPTVQSANPWYAKLRDWSGIYLDIAKSERDIRNFSLSEKYSSMAALWATRARLIKDMPATDAFFKVYAWLKELKTPDLPQTTAYFAAQDAYAKIFITKNTLDGFKNRFCLISHGVPIVTAVAYLDLSIDLYNQKKYGKTLYKIQSSLSAVENIRPEEDQKCTLKKEDEQTSPNE